jgi:DNA polymerase-3 subunit beta
MRISTQRDALFAQLQTVTRAASTRSAVQALSGVQVLAAGGGIELRATDMEIGLRVPLDGEVIREGSVVLPARLVVDVVRSLPGDSVTLELRSAEQDVEIVAGAATFHIRTLRLEDFPPFPEPDGDGRVEVPGGVRGTAKGRAVRVARRDPPVLTGILVSRRRRAAHGRTDSYRLSVKETGSRAPLAGSFEANVPAGRSRSCTRSSARRGRRLTSPCARTRSSSSGRRSCCPRGSSAASSPELPPAADRTPTSTSGASAGRPRSTE